MAWVDPEWATWGEPELTLMWSAEEAEEEGAGDVKVEATPSLLDAGCGARYRGAAWCSRRSRSCEVECPWQWSG